MLVGVSGTESISWMRSWLACVRSRHEFREQGDRDHRGAAASVQTCAAAGARQRVWCACAQCTKLEGVRAQCRQLGAEAIVVVTDVTVEGDCRRLVDSAVAVFGGIDVLVANAGISMHARFGAIEDFSTFERLFRVNAMGTIWCVRYAYPGWGFEGHRRRRLVAGGPHRCSGAHHVLHQQNSLRADSSRRCASRPPMTASP
jgi:NAD(P)-dependent dehydrogenase (short-subunit alcohol dehydrogenase family)